MTAPFTSILVPYDGSEPARAALSLALTLVRPPARLIVLTVVDESPLIAQSATTVVAYDPEPLFQALNAQGRALLADAHARCALSNVVPETEIIHDMSVPGIVATATAQKCDLIVMGTHARTGLTRTFLGSTTEGVLRACDIPVLTTLAGEAPVPHTFQTAVVAVDDSEASDAALALAAELRAAFGTRLIAAHVADTTRLYDNAATYGFNPAPLEHDVERESAGIVAQALQHAGIDPTSIEVALLDGHPAPAILEAIRDRAATVAIVGSHGRRGLRRFVLGSVAEHIVRMSPVPVLVVRRTGKKLRAGDAVQHVRRDLVPNLA